MYGTTAKFSSSGPRVVKVILNVKQSSVPLNVKQSSVQLRDGGDTVAQPAWNRPQEDDSLEEKTDLPPLAIDDKLLLLKQTHFGDRIRKAADIDDGIATAAALKHVVRPFYGEVKGSTSPNRVKPDAHRYRRDQLVEMVQKSLAENLSFQNQRYTTD